MAAPEWDDPLDGLPSAASGGRWNSPGSFPVVYLNATTDLARRYVAHKLRGQPHGPEDLDPDTAPNLVSTTVPTNEYVDIVTDEGCNAAGLPVSYPVTSVGDSVPQTTCWPIGQLAWDTEENGIACRSATTGASRFDEELAWFQRNAQLERDQTWRFASWFFAGN